MHRDGADPARMQPDDFLCDFCGRAWDGRFPMVEGHQGSLICGACLRVAYLDVVGAARTLGAPGPCTMCLEERDDLAWRGGRADAAICRRCIRQGGTRLHKDPDWDWVRPAVETRDA